MSGFRIKDDFGRGSHISEIPASWFNQVGRFLNSLRVTGAGTIDKPAIPSESSPVEISIPESALQQVADAAAAAAVDELTIPELSDLDPVQAELIPDPGESDEAARADHAHPVPLPWTGNLASRVQQDVTGATADTTEWVNTDNTGVGVEIKVCTRWRVISGTQTLFFRNLIFDPTGRLVSSGAEYTRALADA